MFVVVFCPQCGAELNVIHGLTTEEARRTVEQWSSGAQEAHDTCLDCNLLGVPDILEEECVYADFWNAHGAGTT